jgi:hypothetical protein
MRTIVASWRKKLRIHPAYDHQIWFSIAQQVILTILACLVLDEGEVAHGMGAILVGYWIGTVIILLRRPFSPTKGDLLFVRWGCSLLAAAVVCVCLARGLLTGW